MRIAAQPLQLIGRIPQNDASDVLNIGVIVKVHARRAEERIVVNAAADLF